MVNISKETVDIKSRNIQVMSNKGWVPVDYIHKTHSFMKYVVLFESGRELECADNHCLIGEGYTEVMAKNLSEGDIIISDEGIDVVFDIFNTDEYEEMYDITMKDHHLFYTNGILSHNSNIMANIISRQVEHGHNIALASLEMSEDMFAQRFDSIYSNLDINRMYIRQSLKDKLITTLLKKKKEKNPGELFIKNFPTGNASTADYRIWLRELAMRGIKIDAFYFDYINLMKSEYGDTGQLYNDVKKISEQARALGLEFDIPIISVSQLNRGGTFLSLQDVDMNSIAESMGVPATADFMMIMGKDEDAMVYKSEVYYKIVKNRLGGRCGEIDNFYYDAKSLKMYDSSEIDLWQEEALISGDEREVFTRDED